MTRTPDDILDELLVMRAQDGDPAAFAALVERWQPRLWRHAARLTTDPDAAGDVLQNAWLAMSRGVRRLDDPAGFRAWAYRIVTHKAADWIRRRQRDRRLQANVADRVTPNHQVDGHSDSSSELRAALRSLPDEQRTILRLRYLDEFATEEIARVLRIPAGTVKSRLHHARNHLKEVLERNST